MTSKNAKHRQRKPMANKAKKGKRMLSLQRMSWPAGQWVPPKMFAKTDYAYQTKLINILPLTSETIYLLGNGFSPLNDSGATTSGLPLSNAGSTGVSSGQTIANPYAIFAKLYQVYEVLSCSAIIQIMGQNDGSKNSSIETTCVPWNFGDCSVTPNQRINQISGISPEDLQRQRGAMTKIVNTSGSHQYTSYRCKTVSKKSFGVSNLSDNKDLYAGRLNTGMSNQGVSQVTFPARQYGWTLTFTNPSQYNVYFSLQMKFKQNIVLSDPIVSSTSIVIQVPPSG